MINFNVNIQNKPCGPFIVGKTIVNDGMNDTNYLIMDCYDESTLLQSLCEMSTEIEVLNADFCELNSKWYIVSDGLK